jgi:hypothetical protein
VPGRGDEWRWSRWSCCPPGRLAVGGRAAGEGEEDVVEGGRCDASLSLRT